MSRMLVIESSARQEGSVSRQLTRRLVDAWQARHAADTVVWRDLAAQPVPHLDADLLQAWMQPADQLSTPQQQALQRSDRLIEELLAADVLVIAAPMYNFMIPSTLKAWFDHVLRAGVTFRYGANGPEGLLRGKRAVVLTARGVSMPVARRICRSLICASCWPLSVSIRLISYMPKGRAWASRCSRRGWTRR